VMLKLCASATPGASSVAPSVVAVYAPLIVWAYNCSGNSLSREVVLAPQAVLGSSPPAPPLTSTGLPVVTAVTQTSLACVALKRARFPVCRAYLQF